MVAARETKLQELLEGSKQYQVPLYQRTYSWSDDQLERLWEDIVQLANDREKDPELTHFIGSMVLATSPAAGPVGVQEYLVIDGQQRMTTLSILLCAIRDHRAAREGAEHRRRIDESFLINPWKGESHRPKLLPTQADRSAYLACLNAAPGVGGTDSIGEAFRFFAAKLVAADDPDDSADIERIEQAVLDGLALVAVTAQRGDNAHRIFESLNNTGLRLTQGDLLRNYLFMRLPTRGEYVYTSLWFPLQESLGDKNLEFLFWLDLVQRDPRIKQTDTYAGQQRRLDALRTEEEIEGEVRRFAGLGEHLAVLLDPSREGDASVRHRLRRLSAWGTTTVFPLLLHLLDRRQRGSADSEQIAKAMLYVESYFVRRLLIGRATAGINRVLLSIVTEMDAKLTVDDAVHRYLSSGRKYYASDADLRATVRAMPFYLNGRPHQRTLILRWLEESYGSKEPVAMDGLTIEHVLPQTLTDEWREVLTEDLESGEDLDVAHEAVLHTLGNLTLTGYNPRLGNRPYGFKQAKLRTSGLLMNQEIADEQRWGRPQIHARSDALAERIIGLWPGPSPDAARSSGTAWEVMNQALARLPAGTWTTYGDLAALIGTHAVPVGQRLATVSAPNAHRVLQSDGKISQSFTWLEQGRDDDPQDILVSEGVTFDVQGRADPARRVTTEELAVLIGAEIPEPAPAPSQGEPLHARFLDQLTEQHGSAAADALIEVLNAWRDLGGEVEYGTATETSCVPFIETAPGKSIWPTAIYPSGKVEIVFQYMRRRPPFDDPALREELRRRLNKIEDVNLPAAKLDLRPGFALPALLKPEARNAFIDTLAWFIAAVQGRSAETTPPER